MFIDYSVKQMNKKNQILCGDNVEVIKNEDNTIIVLADGLGSGAKANISSTFTKIIISKMLSNGASLQEIIETLEKTLPTCKVRNIAYSTFTVIQIFKNLDVKTIEFGNPKFFHISKGKLVSHKCEQVIIADKEINIGKFKLQQDDFLVVASDGLIHAGRGGLLASGWGWDKVSKFIEESLAEIPETEVLAQKLIQYSSLLEQGNANDDITALVVKIREPKVVNIAIGPPKEKSQDAEMARIFISSEGKKIVCGGTTAKIISEFLHRKTTIDASKKSAFVPSKLNIEGIDLTTEGLLTLSKTVEALDKTKPYVDRRKQQVQLNNIYSMYKKKDVFEELLFEIPDKEEYHPQTPAEELALELTKADKINFFIGLAQNQAYNKSDFPFEADEKFRLINLIREKMVESGKEVCATYF